MSGLRTRIEDAIIVHTERCDCCPLVDKPEKLADVVLRVLAEHGGVKNLREQISLMVWRSANERAERAEADLAAARQQLDAMRELAGKAAPPRYDNGGNYEGLVSGDPARHRAVGSHRAWSDAGEWCYPRSPCRDCQAPVDRADLLAALDDPSRPAGHDETGQ
jgi:hypothetical protein